MKTYLNPSFRVHELVVIVTSHKIFAGKNLVDDVVYFLDGYEEDSKEVKFGLTLFGGVVFL